MPDYWRTALIRAARTAAQTLGAGITSLISGYPGGSKVTQQPAPSALQSALGLGATLAGIYRGTRPQGV